jgi:hypothetical protein
MMSGIAAGDLPLNWNVLVTSGIPTVTSDLPPGASVRMFSPISSTLISCRIRAALACSIAGSGNDQEGESGRSGPSGGTIPRWRDLRDCQRRWHHGSRASPHPAL